MESALTKLPVAKLLIAIVTLNDVFAAMVSPFAGETNFALGMFDELAMTPIGAGLHDPEVICCPFVIGWFTVRQKLMKLFEEVSEATSPASDPLAFNPFCSKPVAMTAGSRAMN